MERRTGKYEVKYVRTWQRALGGLLVGGAQSSSNASAPPAASTAPPSSASVWAVADEDFRNDRADGERSAPVTR